MTSNFKLIFKIQQVLKGKNYKIEHALRLPCSTAPALVITDQYNLPISNKLVIHRHESELSIKKKILESLQNQFSDYEIKFGIDPGHNIGLAVLFHKKILDTEVVYTIDGVIRWIRKNHRILRSNNCVIRLGDGGDITQKNIKNRLIKEFDKGYRIEIVDESNTSIRMSHSRTKHEEAAILIARRKGKPIGV